MAKRIKVILKAQDDANDGMNEYCILDDDHPTEIQKTFATKDEAMRFVNMKYGKPNGYNWTPDKWELTDNGEIPIYDLINQDEA